MSDRSVSHVPFEELEAVSRLVTAHAVEHGHALRAVVLFGELVRTGETYDIELLEVVEGWSGLRRVSFASTPGLPLRGRLAVYILSEQEFESPGDAALPGADFSARGLLARIEPAYAVLGEYRAGYVSEFLRRYDAVSADPLSLASYR